MPDTIPQYGTTQKILTGIEGFDRITGGGIPKEQTTLIKEWAERQNILFKLRDAGPPTHPADLQDQSEEEEKDL